MTDQLNLFDASAKPAADEAEAISAPAAPQLDATVIASQPDLPPEAGSGLSA